MNVLNRFKPLFILVVIFAIVSIACGSSTDVTTQPETAAEQSSESQPGNQLEQSSTKEIQPTKTKAPTSTPTPLPIGLSRMNPFSPTDLVAAPNWNIQILEIKRGEEAWNDLAAANMFNEVPPEGKEYILIKISAESTHTDSEEHSIGGCDFDLTGDYLINYTCSSSFAVEPDPKLDATLYSGGKTEGWIAFLVDIEEGNLMLTFDEILNFDDNSTRIIAIEDGASIKIPEELSSIKPSDDGKDKSNPASLSTKIITEDWEISILEVVRGDEALNMVMQANQFNDPPEEGMEYIAIKVYAKNISTVDKPDNMDRSFFDITGNANVIYDSPYVVGPEPRLDMGLYPGGETEGWIVLQAAIDEENLTLIFSPIFDFSGKNKRFISLE